MQHRRHLVDVQRHLVGLAVVEERHQRRHRRGEAHRGTPNHIGKDAEMAFVTGDVDGERVGAPHVARRAPPSGVVGVDDLQRGAPWAVGVVRNMEPQPGPYDGLAVDAMLLVVQDAGDGTHVLRHSVGAIRRA